MSQKIGSATIRSATPEPGDASKVRVITEDNADLTIHKDIFERGLHGRSYSFANLQFETSADRRRRIAEQNKDAEQVLL